MQFGNVGWFDEDEILPGTAEKLNDFATSYGRAGVGRSSESRAKSVRSQLSHIYSFAP